MLDMTKHKTSYRLLFSQNSHVLPPLCSLFVLAGIASLSPSLGAAGPTKLLPAIVAVTDLGTLGGAFSMGYGVNNKGQAVGMSLIPGNKNLHGFLYAEGKMTDLGTLGGSESGANAVNDGGQVTGHADIKTKGKRHAFLWQKGQMSDLGTSRADDSDGLAISNAGQVAGQVTRPELISTRACLWLGGKVDILDNSGIGGSECDAINSSGQIVGAYRGPLRPTKVHGTDVIFYSDHAVLWQKGKTLGLDTPETGASLAYAINDSGQIAGAASFGKDMRLHACLWQNGKMTDLGTLGDLNTVVYAINRAGQMVGGTNPASLNENGKDLWDKDQSQVAFCSSGDGLIDLNSLIDPASGWALTEARGISDTGYVIGTGFHNGQLHAFLLKLPPVF